MPFTDHISAFTYPTFAIPNLRQIDRAGVYARQLYRAGSNSMAAIRLVLASSLAPVLIELKVETPLSVCHPLERFHGNCEQAITKSADPCGGYCLERPDHSEGTSHS